MSARVVALRVAVVVCTALAGCLPVDTTPPECFADQPCPGSGVCRGGRCVPPSPRAVEVVLVACLGAAEGACRSTLEPRLGVDEADPRVCLVVGSEAVSLRWSPESGLSAPGGEEVVLPLPGGRPLDAGLFFIDESAACDRGLLQAGACEQGRGCVFALRRSGFVAPADDGPVVLDFGQGGCDVRWGEAAPAERCDGRDDDCDGRADESFPLGEACEVGVGACARPGAWVCGPDGASAWCEGEPGAPVAESADGRDEDCDGTIDEGLPGCALSPEGRVCGTDDGICAVGRQRCEVVNGVTVYGACLGADGAPVVGPGVRDERCDGVDEDCDGRVDEAIVLEGSGLAVGDRCPLTPECPVPGRVLCDGGAPGCLPDGVLPVEVCNGADDDCDGVADEDFELGGVCTVGVGGCAREGVVVCGEGETRCDAVAGPIEVERCGDGVDDDCDGEVDEGFGALDMPCEAGRGACVAMGRWACDGLDPTRLVCDAAVSEPGLEQCNALDDDCDGSVDEDFDPNTDPLNCGGCGQVCTGPNVDRYGCVDGGCVIARCLEGYNDVDDDPATGCECNPMQFDAPDPELADPTQPTDPDCDGLDGELDAAVFASALHGDDVADGRPTTPVRSLARALVLAADRDEPIYLDVGRYDLRGETLTVPAGVDIHGGYRFDAEARTWAAARAARVDALSVIAGSPRPLRYVGLDAPTMLDRVLVEAARGEAGRSSVAVVAVDVGDFLQLRDVELRGGDGGAGLMGQAGAAGNEGGEPGGAGRPPSDALCSGCGGDAGRGACQSDGGRGGRGGGGQMDAIAAAGGIGLGVAGGEGGTPGEPGAVDGAVGESGGPGADGVNGDPGSARGRIEAETWVWAPAASPDGNRGAPGSGGGGGGGAWSPLEWFDPGGGGGGGGAGGCPGAGGGGAVGGGGSFSLLVMGGRVRLHGVYMRPGRGGTGGIGGHGGVGSAGQPGGGGVGDSLCGTCGTGGRGGRGGDGGCGGHAGGAAGGPSFSVLRVGRTDALTDAVPALAESGVVFTNPYGAALAAPAADEARGGLAAGIAGQGGGGGALMGCGPAGDEGPAGVEGVVGCCHVEGDRLACAALEGCE